MTDGSIFKCTEITDKHWELLLQADPSKLQIENYILTGHIFELRVKSELVGIIVLVPKTDEQIEIMNLSINEKWQGKGFAKTLIEYACLFSDNKGYRTVTIGTGNSSLNQLALYQKAGFRITGIDHDYFIRHYPEPIYENGIHCRDMIRLERKL